MGCSPSDSFLASMIECFFDASCIDMFDDMANFSRAEVLLPLNSTASRFALNATVSDLANELFIENWFTKVNYSTYVDLCSPMLCSYTYVEQFNLIYTITYVLGLFGGLTIVLGWVTPRIVSLLDKTFRFTDKHKTPIEPISNVQTTYVTIHVRSKAMPKP